MYQQEDNLEMRNRTKEPLIKTIRDKIKNRCTNLWKTRKK